jgi:hypothetical protein
MYNSYIQFTRFKQSLVKIIVFNNGSKQDENKTKLFNTLNDQTNKQ